MALVLLASHWEIAGIQKTEVRMANGLDGEMRSLRSYFLNSDS
jgi:hypothetical protein